MSVPNSVEGREVIIGGGVHAAIYAATRGRMGKVQPMILERSGAYGGPFGRLSNFMLNSQTFSNAEAFKSGPARIPFNTPSESQNYFPNFRRQVWDIAYREYPDSQDIARVVENAIMNYSESYRYCDIEWEISEDDIRLYQKGTGNRIQGRPSRLIIATGLKMPEPKYTVGPQTVISADLFLSAPFVPDGRIAIVGGGDTANIVAEYLLGMSPTVLAEMPPAQFDWYGGSDMPVTKEEFISTRTGRYMGLARHFPESRKNGVINPIRRKGIISQIGDYALVNFERYNLVIDATGYKPDPAIDRYDYETLYSEMGDPMAVVHGENPNVYAIGTCAPVSNRQIQYSTKAEGALVSIYSEAQLTTRFAGEIDA